MHSVTIHKYNSLLTAIEFGPKEQTPTNFVLFIAGLGDGFLSVPYVPQLAEAVSTKLGSKWVLVQALISSSYLGFGTGSLKRDAEELGQLVEYLRTKRGTEASKVVLMGHSTGCQDTMEYLAKFSKSPNFPSIQQIDAGVLQAPVSDSEGLSMSEDPELAELMDLTKQHIANGNPGELLPAKAMNHVFGSPITAYRFHSLVSKRGDDDYFSSYLNEDDWKLSFGQVSKPLLVLYGGKDEFAPDYIDKEQLVQSWKQATDPKVWSKYSKVLAGANHKIDEASDAGAVDDLVETVVRFISSEFS